MVSTFLSGLKDRPVWIPLLIIAAVLVAAVLLVQSGRPAPEEQRPSLMVMSSIPLQWGNASMTDIASGKAEPAPVYARLASDNKIMLVDDLQRMDEPGKAMLLLIQPRALAPSELVLLDKWVRGGGSAIIFADPALDWPSDLPLGDLRRPLFTSLLNPLFRHWGVELALPVDDSKGQDFDVSAGEYGLSLKSPGIWLVPEKAKATAQCRIRKDEYIAVCKVGKGRALLVADADLLHEDNWTGGVLSSGTMDWLEAVIAVAGKTRAYPDSLWADGGN